MYYGNTIWLVVLLGPRVFQHSGCDPISPNVPRRTLFYLTHFAPKSTSEMFAWLLKRKEKKREIIKQQQKQQQNKVCHSEGSVKCLAGTYLTVHSMHACQTRSQLIFSSGWLCVRGGRARGGGGGLDVNAQLITAMHCTAHICNRTEWLQDFIALTSFYRTKKERGKKKTRTGLEIPELLTHIVLLFFALTTEKWHALKTTVVYQKAIVKRC